MRTRRHILACLAAYAAGCQDYTHVFQPATDREGTHLRFEVQQPSKADILFVVDNSRSMREEQQALKASFENMLEALAPRDTSYRIGIVSTDAHGYTTDCCGQTITPLATGDGGNRGVCDSCTCGGATADQVCYDPSCSVCDPQIELRRGQLHHDGTRGRLLAAYDASVFDVAALDVDGNPLYGGVDAAVRARLACAFPTSATAGPPATALNCPDLTGWVGQGVPHVIDRQLIRQNACLACECDVCEDTADDTDACFTGCAKPLAGALVTAYFASNISGLGTDGWGWEEGIQAALMAVGIDPEDQNPATAVNNGSHLTAPGEANSFVTLDATGNLVTESWLREDALLAIMFVADEEDCSMPTYLMDLVPFLEGQELLPPGGYCYRDDTSSFLDVEEMALLLESRKGTRSRVAIGFVGGVEYQVSATGAVDRRHATPVDCTGTVVASESEQPSTACSCVTNVDPASRDGWCRITIDETGAGDTCDALAGDRYHAFAEEFRRHTYDSICREGQDAFGPALRDFADIATLACFELQGVHPVNYDPSLITVKRATREDAAAGLAPVSLPAVDPDVSSVPPGGGWFYDPDENMVCLIGIDRLLGDVYDIFVMTTNNLDFSR